MRSELLGSLASPTTPITREPAPSATTQMPTPVRARAEPEHAQPVTTRSASLQDRYHAFFDALLPMLRARSLTRKRQPGNKSLITFTA